MTTPALDNLTGSLRDLLAQAPTLARAFPDPDSLAASTTPGERPRAVYVLGTIKAGKSTLVNALLGADLLPRGAGVKTFNLCRTAHGEQRAASVDFHPGTQLRERLAFDWRLLGHTAELPEDLWAEDALAALEDIHQTWLRGIDGTPPAAAVDGPPTGLLPRALARIEHTLAGLRWAHAQLDRSTRQRIREAHSLAFAEADFDGYLAFTRTPDQAALIREFRLTLPWPEDTPKRLELVDCQGSDSLNPLDYADVELAMQQADCILYVVQSRLGLRQADRDLLGHLAGAGCADRVLPVMNVEAFDPLQALELEALTQRCNADLQQCLGRAVDILPVNALAALARATGDAEELQLMARLWARREASDMLEILERNQLLLQEELAGDTTQADADTRARALGHQLQATASALLARDAAVLGTEDTPVERAEAHLAVQRVVQGERDTLRRAMVRATNKMFSPEAPLQQEIDQLLDLKPGTYAVQRPVPEGLHGTGDPAVVIDSALETFNQDWLEERARVRTRELRALEAGFRERLERAVARIQRLLPQALPGQSREELSVLLGEGAVDALWHDLAPAHPPPRLFAPVVLPAALRQALAAEFQGRRTLDQMGAKLRRKGTPSSTGCPPWVATLWKRTLAAALAAAREQRGHAVANACENYKHRCFHPLGGAFLERIEQHLLALVDGRYDSLERLAGDGRLLLDAEQRAALGAFLDAL